MNFATVDFMISLMPLIALLSILTSGAKPLLAAVSIYLLIRQDSFSAIVLLSVTAFSIGMSMLIERKQGKNRLYAAVFGIAVTAELFVILHVLVSGKVHGWRSPVFGLSYFAFKTIALQADVYTGKYTHCRISEMLLYLLCFTQLTCGPLSRQEQFAKPAKISIERISSGIARVMTGFCKKVLLADNLALMVRGIEANGSSTALAWLGAVGYSLQLYFDFSGYSDMAIGLTQMLGYDCPENFDYPYMTASVSEFWRRWHITLGAWFRDYVYIPMGGSRVGKGRLICNLFVVWLLTGLWHGISLHYLIWAGGYFVLIVFEKLTGWPKKLKAKAAKLAYRIAVLFFINFQWIWFHATDTKTALERIRLMLIPQSDPFSENRLRFLLTHDAILLAAAVICCFPVIPVLRAAAEGRPRLQTAMKISGAAALMLLFIAAMGYAASGASQPFVYANF